MAREVTYGYYTGTYGGTVVPEAEWDHMALLASQHLERLKALCRVTPLGDEDECESNAICNLAETYKRMLDADAIDAQGVASERVGSVSVSYRTANQQFPDRELAFRNAVKPWLHVCKVVG